MKFESINIYLTGIFVYKYQNNHLPRTFLNYFVKITDKHDHYTRSVTGMVLFVNYCRTNYRGFALSMRGLKIWNTIPNQIRQLNSLVQCYSNWAAAWYWAAAIWLPGRGDLVTGPWTDTQNCILYINFKFKN